MKIEILEFVEGAQKGKGLTVIIDVFRAFSVACYAYDAGAARIIATGEVKDAFELKKKYRNSVLVGERDEKKIEGFDFGNSPTEIIKADLNGETVNSYYNCRDQRACKRLTIIPAYYRQLCKCRSYSQVHQVG